MQNFKINAVPLPALTGQAALARPALLQLMRVLDRAEQLCLRLHGQHSGSAAHVIGITVTQQQRIKPFAQGAQQRHQHAMTGIAFAGIARAGVVQQSMAGGAYQHRVALPDVGRQ